jgi:biotin carboxyl carrier protein
MDNNHSTTPTKRPIFRAEAMASQHRTLGAALWDPLPARKNAIRIALWILILNVAAIPFIPISHFIEVTAYSRPKEGPQIIISRQGGVVTTAFVREGQLVQAGSVLAEVTRDASAENLVQLQRYERERLLEKRRLLEHARVVERDTLAKQSSNLKQMAEKSEAVATLNRKVTEQARARADLLTSELERIRELRKAGFISDAAERSRIAEHLDALRVERLAEAQAASRDADDFKDQSSLGLSLTDTKRQIKEIDSQLLDIERQLERDSRSAVEQIVAARPGKVIQLLRRPGEVVRQGDVVVIVDGESAGNDVEIYFPTALADRVSVGQQVLITETQGDAASPDRVNQRPIKVVVREVTSTALDASALRVSAARSASYILARGTAVDMVPGGHTFRARVKVGSWSLFDSVLGPYKARTAVASKGE